MSDKIFIGKVKAQMMSGATPWEKISISLGPKDLSTLATHKNEQGWINLLFKKSQQGTYYLEVDTWKPVKKDDYQQATGQQPEDNPFESYRNQEPPGPGLNDF